MMRNIFITSFFILSFFTVNAQQKMMRAEIKTVSGVFKTSAAPLTTKAKLIDIKQPDTNKSVTTCAGSVKNDMEPLYIIDGVNSNVYTFKTLVPENIITVSVLKETPESAVACGRSNNVVIIVKTNRGLTKHELRKQRRKTKKLVLEQ